MSKYAVVVVDMQKAYFQAGDLQGKERLLVNATNDIVNWAEQTNTPVFNVVTLHKRDRSTWTRNMLADDEGYLFADEEGSRNLEGLSLKHTTTIVKTRDSAFFATDFADQLREAKVDTLVLLGVSTHSCIYQTASDAYAHNVEVLIAKDAVASHDMQWHEPALAMLEQEYRQPSLTSAELHARLQG